MNTRLMTGLCILSLVLAGTSCLDPFPEKPTTPDRVQASKKPGAGKGTASDKTKKKPEQTYRQAWELICQAERQAGVAADASRDERGSAVADWIVVNVKNTKARYWFIEFGKAKPHEKRPLFEAEVRAIGIEDCALTDFLFATPPTADGSTPAVDAGTGG